MFRPEVVVPIKFPGIGGCGGSVSVLSGIRPRAPRGRPTSTSPHYESSRRRGGGGAGSRNPRRAGCCGAGGVLLVLLTVKPGPWCASGAGWRRSSWRPWGGTCAATVTVAVARTREHDGRRRPRGARGWARRGVHACQPSRGVPQRFRASPRGRLGDEGPTRSTRDSCQTAAAMSPSAANPAAAKAAARTGISSPPSPPRRSVMVGRGVGCRVAAALVGALVGACALPRALCRLAARTQLASRRLCNIVERTLAEKDGRPLFCCAVCNPCVRPGPTKGCAERGGR